MAPKSKAIKRATQKGGDDLDTKLQHAVTSLNELAASLSAVLESRGASVPAANDTQTEETPAAEEQSAPVEETIQADAEGTGEESKEGGGKKKAKAKKAAPKKK